MPDDTTAGATPVESGATPDQSTEAKPNATSPATGAATADDHLGDAGKKALTAEREARGAAERRAKDLETQLKGLQDAQLSEQERKDKRLAELEKAQADWQAERQDIVLRTSVERLAARAGFAAPEDALALLDHTAIQYEPDGTPKNLDALLTKLAQAKPYLLGRSGGSFDTGFGGGQGAAQRTYTRAQLRDTKFFEANRADIMAAMTEGRIRG